MRLYIFTSKLKHLRSAPVDRATTSQCSAVVHLRSATSSQWYIFAVLQWTEPHSSGTSSQCSAVVHLRSGTSSQCSSGQSHFPVVHLRSAPTEPHSVVHLHSAPFRLLFFFFFRLLFFFFFFVRLLFFFFLFFLGIGIYGSSVATLFSSFSSVLGSWVTALSPVLQQVAALTSTRTNQMSLSGSPVSSIGLRDRDAECRGMLLSASAPDLPCLLPSTHGALENVKPHGFSSSGSLSAMPCCCLSSTGFSTC